MNHRKIANLLSDLDRSPAVEWSEMLAGNAVVRIEESSRMARIVLGFWYDQELAEWVVVLSGQGVIEFQEPEERVTLNPGDHYLIDAHRRHRVASTSNSEPTVWLAVFFDELGVVNSM